MFVATGRTGSERHTTPAWRGSPVSGAGPRKRRGRSGAAARGGDRVSPGAHDGSSTMSREAFFAAVARCHEYILAGDIFQVQISRRFALPLEGDAFDVYRILREVNPSPYMFYLATPHGTLVG